jgi:hypothetical protein
MTARRAGGSGNSRNPHSPRLRLEDNQVVVLLRSDSLAHVTAGANAIFGTGPGQAGSLFTVTSIRKGFVGGGFGGAQSLPKQTEASDMPIVPIQRAPFTLTRPETPLIDRWMRLSRPSATVHARVRVSHPLPGSGSRTSR